MRSRLALAAAVVLGAAVCVYAAALTVLDYGVGSPLVGHDRRLRLDADDADGYSPSWPRPLP